MSSTVVERESQYLTPESLVAITNRKTASKLSESCAATTAKVIVVVATIIAAIACIAFLPIVEGVILATVTILTGALLYNNGDGGSCCSDCLKAAAGSNTKSPTRNDNHTLHNDNGAFEDLTSETSWPTLGARRNGRQVPSGTLLGNPSGLEQHAAVGGGMTLSTQLRTGSSFLMQGSGCEDYTWGGKKQDPSAPPLGNTSGLEQHAAVGGDGTTMVAPLHTGSDPYMQTPWCEGYTFGRKEQPPSGATFR